MKSWLLFGAVVGAALLLRLWGVADRPLGLDESWSRWMVEQSWADLRRSAALYDVHPPVYYSLLKAWAGEAVSPLALRGLSVLAGLAMLPLAWATARRVGYLDRYRWAPAFLTAATAFAPALVIPSQLARPYALLALAFALMLLAAIELNRGSRRVWPWLLYLAATEAVLWLHSLGVLFVGALAGGLFLALVLARNWRALIPFVVVNLAAGLLWLPCLLTMLEQRRTWTSTWLEFSWSEVPTDLAEGLAAPGGIGFLLIGLAMFAGVRLWRVEAHRPMTVLLLCAAFGPALLTILLSIAFAPVFLPRALVPSVLPLLLLGAAAFEALPDERRRPRAVAFLAALLLLMATAFVLQEPEEQWTKVAAFVQQRAAPGDEIWVMPNELALPLAYVEGPPFKVPVRGVPAPFPAPDHVGPRYSGTIAVPGLTRADAGRLVAEARRRGVTAIWLISRFPEWFDPQGERERALGAPQVREMSLHPILIERYVLAGHSQR